MSLLPTIFHVVVFSYIVIILGLMSFSTVDAAPVVLFEDSQFKGINSTFQIGESTCVNLVGKLNDFYSSVDSMGTCVLLCEHTNCRGKCEKVGGKVGDLRTIGLNDLVSSISLCDSEDDVNQEQHQDQDVDHPAGQLIDQPSSSNSTRVFHRRSIPTTTTTLSTNRKRYKARRNTARTTARRRSRTVAHKTLPTSSSSPPPSTAQPIVHYLNHDVAWRTTESTTMSSSALPSTAQKYNSNTNNNSPNKSKTTNHLPVGVVHKSRSDDDDDESGGGRRRYRSNRVSSFNTHSSKEFDIAKSYPRRRIPSLSNHRRRRKIFQRQDQQQPIIIQKEESTPSLSL